MVFHIMGVLFSFLLIMKSFLFSASRGFCLFVYILGK